MTQKCSALKSNGYPCLCFARRDDPDGYCVYHSRLGADGAQRAAKPLTKDDLVKMIEATIRSVRHCKLNALEKSRELRALIVERDKLLAEDSPAEKDVRDMTVAERLALRNRA